MIGCCPSELLEAGGVGGEPRLRLLLRGEAELVEEHLPQLQGGVDVELVAGRLDDRGPMALDVGDQPVAQGLELRAVDGHAGVLHAGQHADERHLDVVVERPQPLGVQGGEQRRDEAVDGEGSPRRRRSSSGWTIPRGRAGPRPRRRRPGCGRRRSGRRAPRAGSGSRPGRGGRRPARCRAPGSARRRRGSVRARTSGLAWWAASGRPPGPARAASSARTAGSASSVARAATRRRRWRRPARGRGLRGPTAPRRPPRPPPVPAAWSPAAELGQHVGGLGGGGDRRDLRLEHVGLGGGRTEVGVEGLGQSVEQRVELEELEQAAHLVDVDRSSDRRRGRRCDRSSGDVAHEHHHLVVLAHVGLVGLEVRAQLRRLLVEVLEDAVEPAVGGDELGGGLLPHPGHARAGCRTDRPGGRRTAGRARGTRRCARGCPASS